MRKASRICHERDYPRNKPPPSGHGLEDSRFKNPNNDNRLRSTPMTTIQHSITFNFEPGQSHWDCESGSALSF
jgi:hypothetical protein